MTLPTERIGDKGQRYEVQGLRRETDTWEPLGWTPHRDGGNLASAVRLDPKYSDVRVIDRGKG